jgi:ribose-phosphate pyrophosphokinase
MDTTSLRLFACGTDRDRGERVARGVGVSLVAHEERDFEDGEHKTRPLASVRGAHAFVLSSLHGDVQRSVNDKLCRLLFFVGALKDADAASVTVLCPYLCYQRKDRKTKPRDPVTTRYLAALFEAVGADRVVTVDVHNVVAFQNAFRCRTEHLEARWLFVRYLVPRVAAQEVVVVSPDVGGFKRADRFAEALSAALDRPVPIAFMEKRRSAGVVSGETLVGDTRGRTAVLVDDLVSTGGTLVRAARACRAQGARRVMALATHGLFGAGAADTLADPALDGVVVTDSAAPFRLPEGPARDKLTVLDAAPLLAEAILRMHRGGSLVELLEEPAGLEEAPSG